ncbi:MAG: hypothetical protein K6F46_04260 [Desulfovibrio sp.]|nr:hypothetical protein [Desulfovibrio sp.]
MSGEITNAADLVRNINAGSSLTVTENNQVKTQGFFSKLWQSIGDSLWRSAEEINQRQAKLDLAMAAMLSGNDPLPNLTQKNLLTASQKLSPQFESTLEQIQNRIDIAQFPAGQKGLAQGILKRTNDAKLAKSIGTWQSSKEADPKSMEKFNAFLKEDTNNYLKEFKENPKNFDKDGVACQLGGSGADGTRSTFRLNGHVIVGSDENKGKPVIDEFKKIITGKPQRQLVSTLLTQANQANLFGIIGTGMMPDGSSVPKGFPPLPKFSGDLTLMTNKERGVFSLNTSGGTPGKPDKATVSYIIKYPVQCPDAGEMEGTGLKYGSSIAGYVKVEVQMECDLKGNPPTVRGVKADYGYEGINKLTEDKMGGYKTQLDQLIQQGHGMHKGHIKG